jgi:hypothetical protein
MNRNPPAGSPVIRVGRNYARRPFLKLGFVVLSGLVGAVSLQGSTTGVSTTVSGSVLNGKGAVGQQAGPGFPTQAGVAALHRGHISSATNSEEMSDSCLEQGFSASAFPWMMPSARFKGGSIEAFGADKPW